MAGFTFKLILSGLVAYVPHGDGSGLTILVPETHMLHQSVLEITKGSANRDNETKWTLGPEGKYELKIPKGYDLSIESKPARYRPLDFRPCKWMSPNTNRFIRRICLLDMGDFLPDSAKFNNNFLYCRDDSKCAGLRNRIFLTSGTLKPRRLNFKERSTIGGSLENGRHVVWMKRGSKVKEGDRWAAEAMEYIDEFEGNILAFKLVKRGNPKDVIPVDLKAEHGMLEAELDFSTDEYEFCDCNGSCVPSMGLDHLQDLSKFYYGGPYPQPDPPEIKLLSERSKIRRKCAEICETRSAVKEPVICYGGVIKP